MSRPLLMVLPLLVLAIRLALAPSTLSAHQTFLESHDGLVRLSLLMLGTPSISVKVLRGVLEQPLAPNLGHRSNKLLADCESCVSWRS